MKAETKARVATSAFAPIRDVYPSSDQRIDGLLSGVKWADGTVSYSDPDRTSDYERIHPEPLSDFRRIDADQLVSAHAILSGAGLPREFAGFSVQGFTNLTLRYAGPGSGEAALRYANTSDPDTAYAYYPSDKGYGGDVFFGWSGSEPDLGNYHHLTIIHETGHALGLKHGHERDVFGALPFRQDSMEYSVMTYRAHVGADIYDGYPNEWYGYAQSMMMFDIAALQHMYGADYDTNSGDTVYSWDRASGRTIVNGVAGPAPGENRIFLTVWDGGGVDSYDLSQYRSDLDIDLGPGGYSTFSDGQLAYLGGGPNDGFARGNVFNALLHKGDPRSLIENAFGGSGDDHIRGNNAANLLAGNAGDDRLQGFNGDDQLVGGEGADALYGGAGDDMLDGGGGRDVFDGGHGEDTLVLATARGRSLVDLAAGTARSGDGGPAGRLVDIENVDAGSGADVLLGDAGSNRLSGGGGADEIVGRGGADVLIGGAGRDVFRFLAADDSQPGRRDLLQAGDGAAAFENPGARPGDWIDVSAIDANRGLDGNQAFAFGTAHGVGRLWLAEVGDLTLVRANVDGGRGWDFELAIADAGARPGQYSAADFIL